jgi:hypothetical protein
MSKLILGAEMTYELFCKLAMELLLTQPPKTGFILGDGAIALGEHGLVGIPEGEGWDEALPIDGSTWDADAFAGMTRSDIWAAFAHKRFISFADESKSEGLTRIELDGGKYTVTHRSGTELQALRYGEPWRDLTGDGLVLALCQEIESLMRAQEVVGNDVRATFQALVQEYGRRDGPLDKLMPATDQSPAIRAAMAYLS